MAPALQVGWHSAVEVDARGMIRMCTLQDYKTTCSRPSWDSMMLYADKLRAAGTKVAFFSATPQGGGVALMRHALVRLSCLLNLKVRWYGKCIHRAGRAFASCGFPHAVLLVTKVAHKPAQFRSPGRPSLESRKTCTTSSRAWLTLARRCKRQKRLPSSSGSQTMPGVTGSLREDRCASPRKAAPIS